MKSKKKEKETSVQQYIEQKKCVGEAVLLFRIGDFYEAFYDDAILCSKVLGIPLTTHNENGLLRECDGDSVPLAGFPYHALDIYSKKLVAAGYRVAISERVNGTGCYEIVQIVTAGGLADEIQLEAMGLRDKSMGTA